ncbi:SM-like, degradation of cytoplasmic mRNAs and positively regulates transcription initiation [Bachmanniomyces sp. S44760]|nr:SM-like, degradation of cytoplasmic mRNAs and positively regulates transcription initiation [Bachmanniomyces sp. S44760]
MENLSLQEAPSNAAVPNNGHPPSGPSRATQLPPQMFTTAAQLLDLTDRRFPGGLEKLMLVLRDGRKLIGVLRSWDQFANLVLQDTIERIFVQDLYADLPRGIFLVRGENVLLLGEIDLDKDDYIPEPFRKASPEEIHALSVKQTAEKKRSDKVRKSKLEQLGFEVEHSGEILF